MAIRKYTLDEIVAQLFSISYKNSYQNKAGGLDEIMTESK